MRKLLLIAVLCIGACGDDGVMQSVIDAAPGALPRNLAECLSETGGDPQAMVCRFISDSAADPEAFAECSARGGCLIVNGTSTCKVVYEPSGSCFGCACD